MWTTGYEHGQTQLTKHYLDEKSLPLHDLTNVRKKRRPPTRRTNRPPSGDPGSDPDPRKGGKGRKTPPPKGPTQPRRRMMEKEDPIPKLNHLTNWNRKLCQVVQRVKIVPRNERSRCLRGILLLAIVEGALEHWDEGVITENDDRKSGFLPLSPWDFQILFDPLAQSLPSHLVPSLTMSQSPGSQTQSPTRTWPSKRNRD